MNREQKAAAVEEIAAQIEAAEALFAVDYRGISVPQAAELRDKLNEAGARFRIVKNTLTIRAAEQAGADQLKELLEGPTAFTFVAPDGDIALAAKALSQFRREHDVLEPKGGIMSGEPISIEQIMELARLPGRDVLHGQLVGIVASPITGLVRGLNQLIAGFASQLQQIVDQGLVEGEADEPAPAEEPAAEAEEPDAETEPPSDEEPAEAEQDAQAEEAEGEAEESSGEGEGGEPSTEADTPQDEGEAEEAAPEAAEETESEAPSEGDQEKEGE